MKRYCLDCGKNILGRSDKKFCDDACRSHYNNQKQQADQKVIKKVNGILKTNRTILKRHNPEGKIKIKKERLQKEGFHFEYFTHQYITSKGNIYYFCYEYGYLMIGSDQVLIVKRNIEE